MRKSIVLVLIPAALAIAQGQSGDTTTAPLRRDPKGRQAILRQLESDLRASMGRATLAVDQRRKFDKNIETIVIAQAQQQEQHKLDKGKVKGALKDLERLEKAKPFQAQDQENLDHDQALLRANLDHTEGRKPRVVNPRRRPFGFPAY